MLFRSLLAEALFGAAHQLLEDPLTGLVVGDQVHQVVALRRGVLGVGAHVEVQAGTVGEEDVGGAAPGHDAPEQVAGDLVRAEPPLPPQRARDAVFRSEEHTSELQSLMRISYAVFCLKKKQTT